MLTITLALGFYIFLVEALNIERRKKTRKYGLGEIRSLNFIEVKTFMFKFYLPLCLRSRYMAGLVSPSLPPWP